MKLSPAQVKFLMEYRQGKLNLACGSVRSGKTYVSFPALTYFVIDQAVPNVPILLTAKTGYTLRQNFLIPFKEFLDQEGMGAHWIWKEQPLQGFFEPKGIHLFCIGANDEGAEGKVRGSTVQGWWGDEVTLYPQSFFERCVASLSHNPRTAVLTCNPDRHTHWLKSRYIAGGLVDYFQFRLTDNPGLDANYIENLKKNYSGAEYTRFVEGEWGGGEDKLVVPEFQSAKPEVIKEVNLPAHYSPMVSLDVGSMDFTVALFGHYNQEIGKICIEDEVVIKRNMNTAMLARAIYDKEQELWGRPADSRWSDIDLRLIEDMLQLHNLAFLPTRRDNKDAQVSLLNVIMKNREIIIDPKCETLISHLDAAVWNKRHTGYERNEEFGHYDAVDALIYFIRNVNKTNQIPEPTVAYNQMQGYNASKLSHNPFVPNANTREFL